VLFQYAQVQFAHGRPNEASDALLTAIEMSDRLAASGAQLTVLVARAVDGIALSAFNDNYTSIPLMAAEQILARVKVPDSGLLLEYWRSEASEVSRVLANPQGADSYRLSSLEGLEGMTRAELSTLRTRWDAAAATGLAGMQGLFSQPESTWTKDKGRLDPSKLSADPNVLALMALLDPKRLVETAILWRTQRRLLRVHALIAKSRWENGKLPASLNELSAEAKLDPTAGAPYAFNRLTSSAYDLYSAGNRWFGDIRLKLDSRGMTYIDNGE
jgi:hypothetical protein